MVTTPVPSGSYAIVVDLDRGDLGDAQQGVGSDGNERGVSQPLKGFVFGGRGGHVEGLPETHPLDLSSTPIPALAANTGQHQAGKPSGRRRGAQQLGPEPERGGDLVARRQRLPAREQAGQVAGNYEIGGGYPGNGLVELRQGGSIRSRVLAETLASTSFQILAESCGRAAPVPTRARRVKGPASNRTSCCLAWSSSPARVRALSSGACPAMRRPAR